jgi:hypothetical protein
MNPILQELMGHLQTKQNVVRLSPNRFKSPTAVTFSFADGTTAEMSVDCDHATFTKWWKQTIGYLEARGNWTAENAVTGEDDVSPLSKSE